MLGIYSRWMDRWERKLAGRDTNRKTRPFDWGAEWLSGNGSSAAPANGDSRRCLEEFAAGILADTERFYSYTTPADYRLEGGRLTFSSAALSPYAENNRVYAGFFPARNDGGRAVVVLPQWNAGPDGHVGLCKLLNRFGITALRMSLAYHDQRMPAGLERADYHVSSNVGRTIHAGRQSVVDTRACLDWLESRGYRRLAVLGTSLGSCIAFIAAAHDGRVKAAVFNHISMHFGDVVWTGLSTGHIQRSLAETISLEDLRRYWSVISPASYFDRMAGRDVSSLLIWASHDSTFLPEYSRQVLEEFRRRGMRHEVFNLPCGHYTTGEFPFNVLDGVVMCRFLARKL